MGTVHMKKAHNRSQYERCDICGVRFINVKAHKEKYHFLVDRDKCSLCGKIVKYLANHHCPQHTSSVADKEVKMDCPSCSNLVTQKYLKSHQKNHCVGIRTSTFSNFWTATTTQSPQTQAPEDRIPLQLTRKLKPLQEERGGPQYDLDHDWGSGHHWHNIYTQHRH